MMLVLIFLISIRNMTNNKMERILLYAMGRGKLIVNMARHGKKIKLVYADFKFGANLLSASFSTIKGIFFKNNFLLIHLYGQKDTFIYFTKLH
jgi:hypothetical protein